MTSATCSSYSAVVKGTMLCPSVGMNLLHVPQGQGTEPSCTLGRIQEQFKIRKVVLKNGVQPFKLSLIFTNCLYEVCTHRRMDYERFTKKKLWNTH